jgi:thioredoxin reductase
VSDDVLDAVVVGFGPAGAAAALWLGRYRKRVVVLDTGEPRNRWTEASHGYLYRDGASPGELRTEAEKELAQYETAELRLSTVTTARRTDDGSFVVVTPDGDLHTRKIVLATGARDVFPDIEGFFEHYGADVFTCPACDGYEARDRHVAVIGWGDHVPDFARSLLRWARSVTIVTDGHEFEAGELDRLKLDLAGVSVIEDRAVALAGERGALRSVQLDHGTVACSMAFFSIAVEPVGGLALDLGCEIDGDSCVAVDEKCRTSVEGVWAAGDLTAGFHLVQVAAAEGATAGIDCARSR